jgi:hypothetical protein
VDPDEEVELDPLFPIVSESDVELLPLPEFVPPPDEPVPPDVDEDTQGERVMERDPVKRCFEENELSFAEPNA